MTKPTPLSTHPLASEPPAASQGMPAKAPRVQPSMPDKQSSPQDDAVKASLELPHERDQATDMTTGAKNPEIIQAARDLANGLMDTGKSPEMNDTYKKLKS